ncbi:SAF domain-containing protein [Prauserella rugosa]|uniref:Flp pilus assembly protein CpaB n=1 Tax=Prauserella rugosa TaxID=43354 RepID=A0A660CG69_9PSEU|nr:SAF domain-containing protein [Prauserella rugosa]KMS65928.1 hypothetical protein ACZ91_69905 [Streptomyces regensis]TWH20857.1 Flp pilus assembly protein CpaB [Prauserella rugosa]
MTTNVTRIGTRWAAALRARPLPALRRLVAVALLLLAAVLAAHPATAGDGATRPTLVFARDVALGTTLKAADVRTVELPASARPHGAIAEPDKIAGQRLVGVARQGEPVTDSRLADLAPTPAGTVTVPVRLGDADIAPLLHSGSRVDIVALGPDASDHGGEQVLASDVPVLSVIASDSGEGAARTANGAGPLVLVAAKPGPAAHLAAMSLSRPVTVTLR